MYYKLKKDIYGDYPRFYSRYFIEDADLNRGIFKIISMDNDFIKLQSNRFNDFLWFISKNEKGEILNEMPEKIIIEDKFNQLFEI